MVPESTDSRPSGPPFWRRDLVLRDSGDAAAFQDDRLSENHPEPAGQTSRRPGPDQELSSLGAVSGHMTGR